MAIVVVGGHSRSVGKTSVVCGLIAHLPHKNWLAIKITQYGHGVCSANGSPCDCATANHTLALTEERYRSGDSDTSRFLVAGAKRSLWARTQQGYLASLMPQLREEISKSENVIIESNSVIRFLRPDLYLSVLDTSTEDFKFSAKEFLDRASALIVSGCGELLWEGISQRLIAQRPVFRVSPPDYISGEVVTFVESAIANPRIAA